MRKGKKVLALLLSLMMMISLIPSTVLADEISSVAETENFEAAQEEVTSEEKGNGDIDSSADYTIEDGTQSVPNETNNNEEPGSEESSVSATGVTLDKETLSLKISETQTLTATVLPENATTKDVSWISSDASVAAVTADGAVTAIKTGETDITVTTKDGSFTATCHVTVAEASVPTRYSDYPAESTATVQTGKAYLLSDLQDGEIFEEAEGESDLTYMNYYYERSTDGGQTWSAKTGFTEALFGATTIQLTENAAGVYMYRFYASHDGTHFSKDTWTLTLNVEDNPLLDFTFYVGKDYTGSYPIIKLYNVKTDENGNEVLGDEITDAFRYSDFSATAPEGTESYDVTKGTLVDNYQMFYASLAAGRYAYRAFAYNSTTQSYDIALGGMTLDLPTDSNVDGNKGGGTNVYLRSVSFYTTSRKTDNTYFGADDYHVTLTCPLMGGDAAMGTSYKSGNYTYYPTVLYAAGNACLYNIYAYPDIDGYIFSQSINQTFAAGYTVMNKSVQINASIELTVTVPKDATFGLYFQYNNFNTKEVEAEGEWTVNENGTKTATYKISKSNSNYTWRLSDDTHVTQAGWLSSMNANGEKTFNFAEDASTNRTSHDSSKLGTATTTRDEADLQVNLDASGYKAISDTTRVRAYRYWELINSDTANIMVEPDFHWNVESGDATVATVDGGNASENWADVTAGKQDSIISVYYDSVDVNPGNYGSHGGLYPATQPQRVGFMVVGGSDVAHGTADANVSFNMEDGATTTRSSDWDYNFDTWYYEESETNPSLDFGVTSTGNVKVEYAFAAADDSMKTTVTDYAEATKGEDGNYSVPLKGFKSIGNGKGGTVIIRMSDETGVSYRLVRVAQVTITATNASHKGENIMPGDKVTLTFSGMFRTMNKMSGIFNPTIFKASYEDDEDSFTGSLAQYQKMDNVSITVTVPKDLEFEDGESTTTYTLTNGYTFGTMYSAANPFSTIYSMTDVGVGTNFNAVSVTYYLSHYADANIAVYRKVNYDTALVVPDQKGNTVEGVSIALTDSDGEAVEPDENGRYQLGYGTYFYQLSKDGYNKVSGKFTLGSANENDVKDGILTITLDALESLDTLSWDGTTKKEPAQDAEGVYQIGSPEELAWFADAVNNGNNKISAKLTGNINLGSYDWTPIGTDKAKYTGTFDGDGHVIRNLYINSKANYQGLFGYLGEKSTIKNLGVEGIVTTTAQYAAGIVGYMENYSVVENCYNAASVTAAKSAAGIACGLSSYSNVKNCYNVGSIKATGSDGLAGGIASGRSTGFIPKIENSYNAGTISAKKQVGALTAASANTVTNGYYLKDSCEGATAKGGTEKTSDELKKAAAELGDAFATDKTNINNGYPILTWQQPSIKEAEVTLDKDNYEFTGEAVEPTVTVTLDGRDLVKDEDYTVSYKDNDKAGTGTVVITGADGFAEDMEIYFHITQIKYVAGDNRWETAADAAREAYPEGASTVIMVTGNNFPDALAANALAGALDCPILLSCLDSVPEATEELLKEWNNPNIILVGGNWTCEDELSALGTITERIAGKNRYETAEKIVEYGLENDLFDTDEVIVATGAKAADALSMSTWSYQYKMPILLAKSNGEFTENTQTLLKNFDKVYVAGADNCVKTTALSKIGFKQWKGNMVRLYGNNRYETSYAIARYFLKNYKGATGCTDKTCYAMGSDENFPDALVGGAIAGKAGAPIILVSGSASSSVNYDLTEKLIKNGGSDTIYFLGAIKNNAYVDVTIREALSIA